MAERRSSWPWRKKDKVTLLSPFQTTASSFKYIDARPHSTANGKPESGVYSIVGDARYLEVVRLKEEAEEKARILKEELNAALKEVGAKEAMVKQHEKVAEEAVSGWEKAEKEALSYKEELEAAAKQKSILEDRVVHLNGALKDCMKQVTHVKEEQERKIEETISCKTKEWEGIKAEVDARQVEFERRLMESDAQNCVMTKSLQERARKIMEANDAKERAETEVKVLQVKLGSYEKEISALKYELHVLNKELEIRNEEVECNKKASDAAHKQHLDNVKKLAKLEADCQRLRNLIKKKLPGPAAIAQMRREVEGPQSPCKDMMRRPPIRSNSTVMYTPYQNGSGFSMDFELLKDRMSSMEEETKLLRESLSKKNEELQASRLLCAKTANKLLLAEEQIESLQVTPRDKRVNSFETSTKREPSNACVSEEEEGNMSNMEESSRAESWASALISELALFKKGKAPAKDERREMVQPCSSIEVCTSPKETADHGCDQALTDAMELSENLTKFEDLCSLCKNLDCQLLALQEQVKTLKPDREDAPKQVDTNIILSSIDEAHEIFSALGMALQRFGNIGKQDTTSASLTMDPTPVSSFRVLLCKLILLLETLLPLCNSAPKSSPVVESDIQENTNVEVPSQWEQQKQALVTSKERFLEGKSSVMEFLLRLGIILCEACDMEASDLQGMLVAVDDRGASESTHVNAVGCLEELSLVQDQLQQTIKAKAELESTMASTLQELEGTKAKLDERDELIMKFQEQVAGLESLGKQLAEQEAIKAQLQAKLEAAEVEMGKLQASVATLTLELADKKKLHEEVEAKCKELGQQLQGRLIYEDECNPMKVPDNDDIRLGKERELVVAKEKLAECQRTILALGKQLSSISMSPAELSPGGSFDTTSIDSVSLTMDQRSFTQADTPNGSSREHQQHSQLSNRHANNHHGDGFSTAKYQNGMAPPLYHRRTMPGQTPPLGVPPAWPAESKRRVYEDAGVVQEQPLSWSQHHGSFTRGLGVSGPLAETDLDHHHTYQHHHHQRSSSRPAYVSSSCQYSQRHCEAANSQLTWTYPEEEEESQLALTVSSPPHTAMSSPARSPARYVQQLGGATRGPGRSAVRTSLAESMNAASASSARDLSPVSKSGNKPSPFGKLFSRSNKNHR